MKSFVKIYKHNIYGIIGTLVFHILVVGLFLIAEVSREHILISENSLEIEIPVEYLTEENQPEEIPDDSGHPNPNEPSSVGATEMTNRPSSRGFSENRTPFFDEAYEKEIEAAQKLVADVDKQLAKEIVELSSISMPEDVTEGRKQEDIKNVIYTGESNIVYNLGKRYHLRLPIPVYLAKGGGTIIVDIVVNREGAVISAKARPEASIHDEQVILYALLAARRTVFNADPAAPVTETGTIRYTFIPQ